ncbi:MAG: hypothetical protein AB8B56_04355 [Crocinitomicaceae bacterium]
MKLLLITSVLFVLFQGNLGCSNEQKPIILNQEYDEVLHFQFGKVKPKEPLSEEEEYRIKDFLQSPLPNKLNFSLPNKLIRMGYFMDSVPEKNFSKLNAILECDQLSESLPTECIPIYNDIIIFRKREEIVKIAQLCFRCGQANFIGPWPNMGSFGQKDEFEKLEALLEESID